MKKTTVSFLSQPFVDYQKSCSFLGSCFSENISKKMLEEGFTVHRNPFGVLYNPLSLAKVFTANDEALKASVFERKGVQLSWLANSTCYGKEKAAFQKHVLQIRSDFLKGVEQSSMLILTFGSAFAYKRKESQEIVGNCHKENKDSFTKYLLTVEEMYDVWIKILKSDLLSSRKVILTVSPVRHVKDELIQNTISKARLIELVHRLEKDVEHVFYFPSYEILIR